MAPNTTLVMQQNNTHHGITKSDRRASKPMMEKRRRERINKSLNELKSILLEALRKDSTCHSKLEKADILEMTVRYLRGIQRQRLTAAMQIDPTVASKYRSGFAECKSEVSKYLEQSGETMRPEVKSRLMSHLGNAAMGHPVMMGHPQYMTAAAPVMTGAGAQPIPIHLSPNKQIHALAAAAAALSNGSGYMLKNGTQQLVNSPEAQFQMYSPANSPVQHARHPSGSSVESDASLSPYDNIQGRFVMLPTNMTPQNRTPSPSAIPKCPVPPPSVSPASSTSSYSASSPFVNVPISHSPSQLSPGSNDPVWRPW